MVIGIPLNMAEDVLRTLRLYLAEQNCISEDNQVLYLRFKEHYPPITDTDGQSVVNAVRKKPTPLQKDNFLQWLTQVLHTKSLIIQAFREFLGQVFSSATDSAEHWVKLTRTLVKLYN